MLDQAESLRSLFNKDKHIIKEEKQTRILTITSGKGGVGKSNFVVNLGITLQKSGKKVLILDADIGMGNDDVLMGLLPRYSLLDLLEGISMEDIIQEGPYGLKLLPAGSGINSIDGLSEVQRQYIVEQLEKVNGFDYILIDTGAGVDRTILAFLKSSHEVIIVVTPEPTSITDSYSLIKTAILNEVDVPLNIVVNKATNKNEGEITFNKLNSAVEKFLSCKIKYFGSILDDKKLVEGVKKQIPFTILHPKSDASRSIELITKRIDLKEDNKWYKQSKRVFKRLMDLLS